MNFLSAKGEVHVGNDLLFWISFKISPEFALDNSMCRFESCCSTMFGRSLVFCHFVMPVRLCTAV